MRLGFADASDLTTIIEARIDADICVWLLHERRAGRSFALPRDESKLPGVALAVCYGAKPISPNRSNARLTPIQLHLFMKSSTSSARPTSTASRLLNIPRRR